MTPEQISANTQARDIIDEIQSVLCFIQTSIVDAIGGDGITGKTAAGLCTNMEWIEAKIDSVEDLLESMQQNRLK